MRFPFSFWKAPVGAPTITAVAGNWGSAAGGWTVYLTGANLNTPAVVTIGGVPCTGVGYNVSLGMLEATAPAFPGGSNGSVAGQTITVRTAGGSATGSGTTQQYFYLPSNNQFMFAHRADVGVTLPGGNIDWADTSGNGIDWTGTSGSQPTSASAFNGTIYPYFNFDGVSQFLISGSVPTIADGSVAIYFASQLRSLPGTAMQISFGEIGIMGGEYVYLPPYEQSGDFLAFANPTTLTVAGADTNAHIFAMNVGNAVGQTLSASVDATIVSTTLTDVTTFQGKSRLGFFWFQAGSYYFAPMNYFGDVAYVESLSTADDITVRGIMKAVCGTP